MALRSGYPSGPKAEWQGHVRDLRGQVLFDRISSTPSFSLAPEVNA
jgi:hypothetical protein